MKIAYLINQYPKVSHSFIRREIIALEKQGLEITRYSIRPTNPHSLVDQEDKLEREKTQAILSQGIFPLLINLIFLFFLRPLSLIKSFFLTLKMGQKSHRGILRHIAYLAEACTLWRSLQAKNITHIHAHFGTNSTAVALLCHNLGYITYSFTVHGPEEFDQPEALSLKTKIEQASFVVAISSYGKSQLYRWCDFKQWAKIKLIRCGVDPTYLEKPFQAIPETSQLVCVGRLCEQKGQLLLVQAANILKEQGVQFNLVLVGDGEMRSPVENLIRQYNLEAEIAITGWANSAEVQKHLLNSRGLVLPSFAEGLPVVIMESLALARPVISTYIAGIPELVEPQNSGWLVYAGCVASLADAMQEMLQTPVAKLTEMGKIGQIKVQQNHDINLETSKLAQLIGQIKTI
jgi:glycosyltransferase involved in cell wall biosynthesis